MDREGRILTGRIYRSGVWCGLAAWSICLLGDPFVPRGYDHFRTCLLVALFPGSCMGILMAWKGAILGYYVLNGNVFNQIEQLNSRLARLRQLAAMRIDELEKEVSDHLFWESFHISVDRVDAGHIRECIVQEIDSIEQDLAAIAIPPKPWLYRLGLKVFRVQET